MRGTFGYYRNISQAKSIINRCTVVIFETEKRYSNVLKDGTDAMVLASQMEEHDLSRF